jgi:hypothetical protein
VQAEYNDKKNLVFLALLRRRLSSTAGQRSASRTQFQANEFITVILPVAKKTRGREDESNIQILTGSRPYLLIV